MVNVVCSGYHGVSARPGRRRNEDLRRRLPPCLAPAAIVGACLILVGAQAFGDAYLRPVGDQFVLDGAVCKIKGTNYYPASAPWSAWFGNWNWAEITGDIERMRTLGINVMRINLPYSYGGWGGPNVNPTYLDRLERLVEYLRYRGMKANITMFDWETSFPAAGTQTEVQHKQYVSTIVGRLKDNPGVFLWDVKNEPDHPDNIGGGDDWKYSPNRDKIVSWLNRMCQHVRSIDTNHSVGAGIRWWANVDEVIDFVDVGIFHNYWANIGTEAIPFVKNCMGPNQKPILVQEFGWPSQPHPAWRGTFWQYDFTEADQLNVFRMNIEAFLQHNIAGGIQWQCCDLKGYVSDPNSDKDVSFENYFGLWRMGGALKPAAIYYRDTWPAAFFPYSDDTVPAPVTGVSATGQDRAVTLTWTHSASPDCAGVLIRCSASGYPATVADGIEVARVAGEGKSQGTACHTGLSVNTTYYYSLFAYDYAGHYSVRATATATTLFQPGNLLAGPGIDGFSGGVALGWTPYSRCSTGGVPTVSFTSDTSVYQTGGISQRISNFGSDAIPDSAGGYAHAGIMQTVAAEPGKTYLLVGYEKLSSTSADQRYFRTFGVDPSGSADPGVAGACNVAGACWMGPAGLYWNCDADGSNLWSGMFKCVSAVTATGTSVSCWAGIGVSLIPGRLPTDRINYDSFYLHAIDNPVNSALVNGNMEGLVFDCNDADVHIPSGWVPAGGSYGKFAGYNVSTYSGNAHGGTKSAVLLCYPGKADHALMQRVRTYPGETLTASAWFRGVSSGSPTTSAAVGIDPTGGTDMFGASVVWTTSVVGNRTSYGQVTASATAQSTSATVFIRAMSGSQTTGYHTVYVDDASFTAAMSAGRPGQLKGLPDGRAASINGCIVTAKFGGYFYVEDEARTSGIRVVSSTTVQVGQKVNVSGVMGTVSGERCVQNATVSVLPGSYPVPKPLGIACRALGGEGVGPYTPGVSGGVGPNNVGLLVRTWGKVIASTANYFTIADGAGRTVTVYSTFAPATGRTVSVTGISGCEIPTGESIPIPVVRTRDSADVRLY
jgi:hypothetical protein